MITNTCRRAACAAFIAVWFLPGSFVRGADAEPGAEFFERKIRPLLVQHCFACHGKGQKKGGLSLESRETLMAGGESGAAIQLDAPAKSLLIEAVEYSGDVQMPPSGKLADHEIALLRQWTAAGLPWPKQTGGATGGIRTSSEITHADREFWSFRPFVPQPLPAVNNVAWPRTRMDVFLLNRLESESLGPSHDADRRTWLRRSAFDLTGLPPHDDHLAEFSVDEGPDAFERATDRLLASPRHGERWARHWLDLARYGEDQAHTFSARTYPSGYRFRDWVIRAFNHDLPYNDFVAQQIAGDLLVDGDSATKKIDQAPGLGFFALGPVYYADAGCAPKAQADEWDDRVDTLARGLLGLTLACARCHDHKFDPITVQDYYALAGVFASTRYEEIPLVPADVVKRYDEAVAKSKAADEQLAAAQTAEIRQLAEAHVDQTNKYVVAAWTLLNRRKVQGNYAAAKIAEETGLKEAFIEGWRKHLGAENRNQRGHLAMYDQQVAAEDAKTDLSQNMEARQAVEAIAVQLQETLVAAIAERARREEAYKTAVAAAADDQKPKIAKPQLDKPQADLLQAVLYDGKAPFALAKDQVAAHASADAKAKLQQLAELAAQAKQAVGAKYPIAHGLADAESKNLKIHLRGNHKTLGDEVPRRFLSILSTEGAAPFSQGSGRLELARAVSSTTNPLTARVMVNRVWQQHFGRGIVDTPSNFGTLGAPPSHPELLDDLTSRFVAAGWSLKQLHREIVTSAAYRQSSAISAEGQQRDPENRLLWRAPRQRLDVEVWRDAMLLVTGQLNLSIGGPSQNLNDANHRRRTLYSTVSRHDLDSMLRLFDFPDPNLTSERRSLTTVPMQQLFMLNSDFMVRQARALAARLSAAPQADDTSKVLEGYQLVFQREPTSEEREFCVEFVRRASEDRQAKLSSWEQFAQALLAANEFMFVD